MSGITIEPYEAKDGWRWRAIDGNNRIVGDSAESYGAPGDTRSESHIDRAILNVRQGIAQNYIEEFGSIFGGSPTAPFDQEKEKQDAER